jgi:DNA-binding transcriptional MerR regulator
VARPLRDFDGAGELTIGEAARALGVVKNSVRSWPASELPYHRIGRRGDRRYRAADVVAYIDARQVGRRGAVLELRTLERMAEIREADRTFATVTKVLDGAGRGELARRLRHARAIVNDLLDTRG